MIGDHPLLGIGANNFALLLPQYVTAAFSQDWLYLVHNRYLLVWAETGTLGLLAFVSLLATTAWAGGRVSCVQLLPLAPVVAAFAATVVGQSLHMLVDIFNSRPQIQLVLVVAALIHSSTQIVAKEQACRAVRL
jgi:O-antigen ligase